MTWRTELIAWEREYLTTTGDYRGRALRSLGFPFNPGEYVPTDQRYSAMLAHSWANRALRAERGEG